MSTVPETSPALPQEVMIARVRELCHADDRLDAAMMYGSFAYGEGDRFSDIEFLLFFRDDAFEVIDPRRWLDQVAPVIHLYVNEHGIHAAIFDNLVRGEFHFHRASEVTVGEGWPGVIRFPSLDSTLIVDKSGRLTPYLEAIVGPPLPRDAPDQLQALADGFVNWWLFGFNVLRRGEQARALEILTIIHRHLLHMARVVEGTTAHWLTPSRLVERDLSPESCTRYAACTAALDGPALRRAYRQAWAWGGELVAALGARYPLALPEAVCARIAAEIARLGEL